MSKYKWQIEPAPTPAVTIKEIKGACIPTIPAGTPFEVTYIHKDYSYCKGLPISMIWNWEFAMEGEFS